MAILLLLLLACLFCVCVLFSSGFDKEWSIAIKLLAVLKVFM